MDMISELNIGRAGEFIALADILLHDIQAYPTDQGVGYDIVADVDGKLLRIQVKTTKTMRTITQRSNPIYFFHIKRHGKDGVKFYKYNDFDCYALVALDKRLVFYLPFNKAKSNSVCVRDKNIDYSGKRGGGNKPGLYYQDLTLDKCLEEMWPK